jgi:malate/lactate dehydrogenase
MKYLVLGAGMMGSAAAYDLARSSPDNQVVLADINIQTAKRSAGAIGANVHPVRLDVNSNRDLAEATKGCDAVISAVTIRERGVKPPEQCVPGDALIDELGKRTLRITKRITETWS